MNDAKFVNVFDTRQNLGVHLAGLRLLQSPILNDVLEEFTTRAVLHDQVQVVIVFNHLKRAVS